MFDSKIEIGLKLEIHLFPNAFVSKIKRCR